MCAISLNLLIFSSINWFFVLSEMSKSPQCSFLLQLYSTLFSGHWALADLNFDISWEASPLELEWKNHIWKISTIQVKRIIDQKNNGFLPQIFNYKIHNTIMAQHQNNLGLAIHLEASLFHKFLFNFNICMMLQVIKFLKRISYKFS